MILGSAQTSGPTNVTAGGGGVSGPTGTPGGPTGAPGSPGMNGNASICQLERIAAVNTTDIVRRLNSGELGPEAEHATGAPATQGALRSSRAVRGPPFLCEDGPREVGNFYIQLL